MTNYFKISGLAGPWVDYGAILRHGLARRGPDGLILQRTGPFVPRVSCPFSEVVVDEIARAAIEESGASGFSFQPVKLDRVVNVPWETWLGEPEPCVYPENGEPESYILDAPNDVEIAEKMPRLFSIEMPRIRGVQGRSATVLNRKMIPDADVFGSNAIWVSEVFANAIRPYIDDYVRLEIVKLE